jgi:hypothetical protein
LDNDAFYVFKQWLLACKVSKYKSGKSKLSKYFEKLLVLVQGSSPSLWSMMKFGICAAGGFGKCVGFGKLGEYGKGRLDHLSIKICGFVHKTFAKLAFSKATSCGLVVKAEYS